MVEVYFRNLQLEGVLFRPDLLCVQGKKMMKYVCFSDLFDISVEYALSCLTRPTLDDKVGSVLAE